MKNILIVGATSGIAMAVIEQFALNGSNLALAGRDMKELHRLSQDLIIRYGITAVPCPFEALDYDSHEQFWNHVVAEFGDLDGIISCYGYLGDQRLGQEKFSEAKQILEVNFLSNVSLLNIAATYFEQRGSGFLCALSSVAGDRGRQSNYLYGSAKGALALYLQGLRNRLHKSGVSVITVKPGFVDTKMTFGMEGMFLVAKPESIAKGIYKAILKSKNNVYLPGFWRWIMLIIRNIPESIFKKMSL